MHAITFATKRAFQSMLRFTRRMFASWGITAARFDMLFAVRERGADGLTQKELCRELGVTPPTVSRMVASLETLGLVRREPDAKDKRLVRVWLTEKGVERMRVAVHELHDFGLAGLIVEHVMGTTPLRRVPEPFDDMETIESLLRTTRYTTFDFANLYYPWQRYPRPPAVETPRADGP